MARTSNPKQRIMDTAERLFYHQGYNSTGINQILEEADVAKASLYAHFGSKDQLGVEYLKAARVSWFKKMTAVVDKKEGALNKLLACFDLLQESMLKQSFRGCKFLNMSAEIADDSEAMRRQIREQKADLRKYISKLALDAAKDAGRTDGQIIADTAYLLFEAALVESKVFADPWPIRSARKAVKHLLTS
jgi:AcrR family transcriptional regulator